MSEVRNGPPRWTLIGLAWMAFGLVWGLLTRVGPGAVATWRTAMLPTMGAAIFWFAASPAIAGITRRIRDSGLPWFVRIALHLVPCAIMVLATAAVMWGIRITMPPPGALYWVRVFISGDLTVFQYIAVVVLVHVWDRHVALMEHERRSLVLEQQLMGARLLYLERQLRPHFLFNCLNAIAEMAHISTDAAAHMMASLRQLLTSAVQTAGRAEVPLREELATLDAYLDLQRARFMGSIEVEQVIAPDALDAGVPPLLLQPVVENAIQHGLDRVDGHGVVRIVVSVRSGRLLIEVEDNGSAGPPTAPRGFGIGLRNTRERIETLFGEHGCSLELELRPAGGALTRIDIPLSRIDASARGAAVAGLVAGDDVDDVSAMVPEPVPITARLPIVLLVCVLAPIIWSVQIWALYAAAGEASAFEFSGPDMVAGAAWMLIAPCALYLGERFPVRGAHARRNATIHLALAVCASLLEGLIVTSTGLQGDRPILAAANAPQRIIGVLAYLVLVGWTQADVFARWYHDRRVVSTRLRTAIERARWRAATLELQPELVLSALDAAEQQVAVSVDRAENTLYELSDLLRSQLALSREALIPLDAEVRHIASTQRLRAHVGGDGPRITVTVPRQFTNVRVPSGVLRRLAEASLDGSAEATDVELRLDGIRYLRQEMEMRLFVLLDGEPLSLAATEQLQRRVQLQDVAPGHAEIRAAAPGEVVVLTDLAALQSTDVPGSPQDALRSGESVAAIISSR
ncbi:MAG: histidine kinase [Gemmatimonadaceae bacterium]